MKVLRHFSCTLAHLWRHLSWQLWSGSGQTGVPPVLARLSGSEWVAKPAGEDDYAVTDVHVNGRKATSESTKEARRTDLMEGSERVEQGRLERFRPGTERTPVLTCSCQNNIYFSYRLKTLTL